MNLRICIISDAIESPFDEGVKIFALHLIKEMSKNHELLGLSRSNNFDNRIEKYCAKAIPQNKLYISSYLRNRIREFKPDVIYYIPVACATIYSFIRAKILKLYSEKTKTIMITLQPRKYSPLAKMIIPLIAPDLIFAQSVKTKEQLETLGCRVKMIPSGVDCQRFKPVDKRVKENMRRKYSLPLDKYIVLHVGHINTNRNMQFMERVQNIENIQVVVVGSTSYPEDKELVQKLRKRGIIVICDYIENIEEIYQSADCYLFPVFSENSCIEIPLSVLEAMACNLPVVSTRFGGLRNLVSEQNGFLYADTEDEILSKISFVKTILNPKTRNLTETFSWQNVVQRVLTTSLEQ